MLIREFSDLHNEFSVFEIPELPEDKDTILILAGDTNLIKYSLNLYDFLKICSEQFRAVIYVLGNHESYRGSLKRSYDKVSELIAGTHSALDETVVTNQLPTNLYHCLENVYLLEDEKIVFDDVLFIGSTLWTNFHNGDPFAMQLAKIRMNDFKIIRYGPSGVPYQRKFDPADALNIHIKSKEFIFNTIKEQKNNYRKVVVITHHGPTLQSVHPIYRNSADDMLNYAYTSDLSCDILDTQPDLWFHGHTHMSFDYEVDKTRVICNPRGYVPSKLNFEFDPRLQIKV